MRKRWKRAMLDHFGPFSTSSRRFSLCFLMFFAFSCRRFAIFPSTRGCWSPSGAPAHRGPLLTCMRGSYVLRTRARTRRMTCRRRGFAGVRGIFMPTGEELSVEIVINDSLELSDTEQTSENSQESRVPVVEGPLWCKLLVPSHFAGRAGALLGLGGEARSSARVART